MKPLQHFRIAALLTFAVLTGASLLGCKPDAAVRKGEVIDQGTRAPKPPSPSPAQGGSTNAAGLGSITGLVNWKGPVPARLAIDMSMDPACSMSDAANQTEQYVVHNGRLANVFLYVKNAPSASAPPGQPPVVLDQKGCRYIPHVIAVQQGASVVFTNSDPTVHNVHTTPEMSGNGSVDLSESPRGAPQTEQFKSPELMVPVRCNNHPWMNAFINVAASRYFALTGEDGAFTIQGLPPGTYTVAAVHEKLGEQDLLVSVPAKGAAKASFSFAAR